MGSDVENKLKRIRNFAWILVALEVFVFAAIVDAGLFASRGSFWRDLPIFGSILKMFFMARWSVPFLLLVAWSGVWLVLILFGRMAYMNALRRGELPDKPTSAVMFFCAAPVSMAITLAALMAHYATNRYSSPPPPEAVDTVECTVVESWSKYKRNAKLQSCSIRLLVSKDDSLTYTIVKGARDEGIAYYQGIRVGDTVTARVVTGRNGFKYIDGDSLLKGHGKKLLLPDANHKPRHSTTP